MPYTYVNMGQCLSGVAGRGLPSLARNGYDARRQLDPEELKDLLRPLYDSLFQEIGYTSAVSLDADAIARLHKAMQQKADLTGLDYLENTVSAKGFTLGLSLACVSFASPSPPPPSPGPSHARTG